MKYVCISIETVYSFQKLREKSKKKRTFRREVRLFNLKEVHMNSNLKNKMVFVLFIFIFISFIFPLKGDKVATLKEVIKPDMMQVKNGKLYVLERTTIFIYSLKDFSLLKKFGREGEGPKEFQARPFGPPMSLSFYSDNLVVNSNNKLSYFKLNGDYVNEEKAPPGAVFYRVKDGYLGIGSAIGENNRPFVCFRLFGLDFQAPKMLYQSEITLGQGIELKVPMNALNYYPIYKDKIFIVEGKKGFVINCFDHKGNKLYDIKKKEYEKTRVTETYKQRTIDWFKNHPTFRAIFPGIKDRIIFKEYFPIIKNIAVDNDVLYVITNNMKHEQWECIIMDLKGKELKRVFVPLQDSEPYTYYPLLCAMEKGKYYALIEDEDEETWELHMKVIK